MTINKEHKNPRQMQFKNVIDYSNGNAVNTFQSFQTIFDVLFWNGIGVIVSRIKFLDDAQLTVRLNMFCMTNLFLP